MKIKEFMWTLSTYITAFKYRATEMKWPVAISDSIIKEYFDAKKEPKDAATLYVNNAYNREIRKTVTLFKKDIEGSGRRSVESKLEYLITHPNQRPNKILTIAENIKCCQDALNPPTE